MGGKKEGELRQPGMQPCSLELAAMLGLRGEEAPGYKRRECPGHTSSWVALAANMRTILIISLLSCFFAAYNAKVFSKCELARQLKAHGMDGFHGYSLANWVCMAEHESSFNTRAFNGRNSNGSSDYGIFQLNNQWWCKDNKFPSENACNIMCSKFLDDNISDDINCIKRVVRDPNGMSAWVAWVNHCKNRNLSQYLAGCQL
ncbi:lysozyme C, milk isozyme-like [Myotis myotis]|uniref:lysozyme C, milk isozyme-like n=1 Tax=Myotis myotis TaxID=51298 RepID=UPI001748AE65|nr:lysozyme C, milk isozyme-like [Myotis myotis]